MVERLSSLLRCKGGEVAKKNQCTTCNVFCFEFFSGNFHKYSFVVLGWGGWVLGGFVFGQHFNLYQLNVQQHPFEFHREHLNIVQKHRYTRCIHFGYQDSLQQNSKLMQLWCCLFQVVESTSLLSIIQHILHNQAFISKGTEFKHIVII